MDKTKSFVYVVCREEYVGHDCTPDTALIYASLDKKKADSECARLSAAASAEEDLLDAEDEEDEENHGSFRGHQISYFVESLALKETTENA